MMEKTFEVSVCGTMRVTAANAQDAVDMAIAQGLPDEAEYKAYEVKEVAESKA